MTRIHKECSLIWLGVKEQERVKQKVGLIMKPNSLIDIVREKYVKIKNTDSINLIDKQRNININSDL